MMRSKIKEISNVYIDMFDVISRSNDNACMFLTLQYWLQKNNLTTATYGEIVVKLKEFLESYNYKLVHAYNMVDIPTHTITGDVVGKFYIIKDEDKFLQVRTNKPLRLYATKDIIGKLIGIKGCNINSVVAKLNESNKFWNVPYISINDIEKRTTNNNQEEINKKFLELLDIIF